jgi:hypothetical protein
MNHFILFLKIKLKASRAVAKNGFALNIIEAICWFILVNPYETNKTTHWQVLYVLAGTVIWHKNTFKNTYSK